MTIIHGILFNEVEEKLLEQVDVQVSGVLNNPECFQLQQFGKETNEGPHTTNKHVGECTILDKHYT
jgi:hypothetical protein